MGGREEAGKIFVGGLSWNTDQASLQGYFSQFGEITDCIVMKNPSTGKSRGFGFVSFKDPATVEVILSSKSHVLDGRTVDAKACNARGTTPKPQSRGGFGGGGGGMTGRTTKIFVGGLPNNVDEDTIREAFGRFGNVTEVVIMYDHEKQRSRGFGFLTFDNEDSVEQACGEHYVDVNGKQVECKKAEPRGAGGRGVGSGGGRGGGRGGGAPGGGFGGGPQGWGGGPQQGGGGNWNQGGWNQDFNQQQNWSGQQGWGNQGGYSNGWQGICGMPSGAQGFGIGAMPLPVAAPHILGSEPSAHPGVANGDGGCSKSDGRPTAQTTHSPGQNPQQNMGGYGGYSQYQQGGYGGGQQGQGDNQQGGGNFGYSGGYGDSQQGGYGGPQGGYGSPQGGYGGQQGSFGGNQPNGPGSDGNQGMGGGYQQRQAPGNTGGGGGRGGGSQNFHPYSR